MLDELDSQLTLDRAKDPLLVYPDLNHVLRPELDWIVCGDRGDGPGLVVEGTDLPATDDLPNHDPHPLSAGLVSGRLHNREEQLG